MFSASPLDDAISFPDQSPELCAKHSGGAALVLPAQVPFDSSEHPFLVFFYSCPLLKLSFIVKEKRIKSAREDFFPLPPACLPPLSLSPRPKWNH